MNNAKRGILLILLLVILLASVAGGQTGRRRTSSRVVRKPRAVTAERTAPPCSSTPATTTPSGLTYMVTQRGQGRALQAGETVLVHYTGLLTNGVKFDSSHDRRDPFAFRLGAGQVIKGWDEGVAQLRIGDHATLTVPPDLGYGANGAGGVIPPNATLIFIVEVVGVRDGPTTDGAPQE